MRIFGFEITRKRTLSSVHSGGWRSLFRISEPYSGAWQRNREWSADTVAAHHAVYACVTLIASDIGKLRPKLVEQLPNGIWRETSSPAFSPVLKKPNTYQTRIQFFEWWATSKLLHGNAYALKERDARGVVVRLHLLDPNRVKVLVSTEGDVFYQLQQDDLAGVATNTIPVPAREIIHDRINCLFHPLVGTSPIYACGVAAGMGLSAESSSERFFNNDSTPSGVLSSPERIPPEKAKEYSEQWEANFGPQGRGGVAVLGFGMKYEPMRMKATDA